MASMVPTEAAVVAPKRPPAPDDPVQALFAELQIKAKEIDGVALDTKGRIPSAEEARQFAEAKRDSLNLLDQQLRVYSKLALTFIILLIIIVWLIFIRNVIWNFGWKNRGFYLSDTVLVTLLTTTTANILVMMYYVVKHFFPSNEEFKSLKEAKP